MATLADELLNDFEDSGDENGENENGYAEEEQLKNGKDVYRNVNEGLEVDANDDAMSEPADEEAEARFEGLDADEDDEIAHKAKVEKMQLGGVSDVRSVAGLMKTLQPVLEQISYYQNQPSDQRTTHLGSIEDNPEYKLLTLSNSLSTQIDSEIVLVHKFIRDHYSTRFPELETLISNPLDYARTVAILKNGPLNNIKALAGSNDNLVRAPLQSIPDFKI